MRYFLLFLLSLCLSARSFAHPFPGVNLGQPFRFVYNTLSSKPLPVPSFPAEKQAKHRTRANGYQIAGGILGFSGVGLIGWAAAPALTGAGKVNWKLAAAGGTLIAISIPFSIMGNRHQKENGESEIPRNFKRRGSYDTEMELVSTRNEVGLRLHFK